MAAQQKLTKRRGPATVPAEVRFAAKCRQADSECVEWVGSVNSTGYGTFHAGPQGSVMAHRWAYEHKVGPIRKGLHLDHLCKNTVCVNPDHLEPVTARENLLRGDTVPAKNAAKTHCPYGHPYSSENTYTTPRTNNRGCRTCMHERDLARSIKNRKV